MRPETEITTIQLLENEYRFACPPEEREALLAAADYLNARMLEIRNTGRHTSPERIGIAAAINICHELLSCRRQAAELSDLVDERARALTQKVDAALSNLA